MISEVLVERRGNLDSNSVWPAPSDLSLKRQSRLFMLHTNTSWAVGGSYRCISPSNVLLYFRITKVPWQYRTRANPHNLRHNYSDYGIKLAFLKAPTTIPKPVKIAPTRNILPSPLLHSNLSHSHDSGSTTRLPNPAILLKKISLR